MKARTREQVLKLWIKALRSGEYKQTQGLLRVKNSFCCLGVLCDLQRKDGGGGRWVTRFPGSATDQKLFMLAPADELRKQIKKEMPHEEPSTWSLLDVLDHIVDNDVVLETDLPQTWTEWLGVDTDHLMGMNDDGQTFKEIADYIETTYLNKS